LETLCEVARMMTGVFRATRCKLVRATIWLQRDAGCGDQSTLGSAPHKATSPDRQGYAFSTKHPTPNNGMPKGTALCRGLGQSPMMRLPWFFASCRLPVDPRVGNAHPPRRQVAKVENAVARWLRRYTEGRGLPGCGLEAAPTIPSTGFQRASPFGGVRGRAPHGLLG